MAANARSAFTRDFWKSFEFLGIYSKEDGPLLADQEDAGVVGGANSSDDTSNETSETNEQNNDMNLDMGSNAGPDLGGGLGGSDMGGDLGGDTSGGGSLGGGASAGTETQEETDPKENPFKKQNGQALLDNKLAELQAAVSDTLQRIYSNPKIDTVVVSEMEALLDSVRNLREINYLIPIEQLQYKYDLATVAYAKLSQQLVLELQAEIKKL